MVAIAAMSWSAITALRLLSSIEYPVVTLDTSSNGDSAVTVIVSATDAIRMVISMTEPFGAPCGYERVSVLNPISSAVIVNDSGTTDAVSQKRPFISLTVAAVTFGAFSETMTPGSCEPSVSSTVPFMNQTAACGGASVVRPRNSISDGIRWGECVFVAASSASRWSRTSGGIGMPFTS